MATQSEQSRFNKNRVITASEIGQYHYCPMAWYLQRSGYEPDSPYLDLGTTFHRDTGDAIEQIEQQEEQSTTLKTLAILLILLSFLFLFLGVIL